MITVKAILYVFMGGGAGSVLRYLAQMGINSRFESVFPFATWAVNVVGSFLIGAFFLLSDRYQLSLEMRLLLTVGFCGGFTTFSTFSNESLQLLKEGSYALFLLYTIGSVSVCLLSTYLGAWSVKEIAKI